MSGKASIRFVLVAALPLGLVLAACGGESTSGPTAEALEDRARVQAQAFIDKPGDTYDFLSERCRAEFTKAEWGMELMMALGFAEAFGIDFDGAQVGEVEVSVREDQGSVMAGVLLDGDGEPIFGEDWDEGDGDPEIWVFENGRWYSDECESISGSFEAAEEASVQIDSDPAAASPPSEEPASPETTVPLLSEDDLEHLAAMESLFEEAGLAPPDELDLEVAHVNCAGRKAEGYWEQFWSPDADESYFVRSVLAAEVVCPGFIDTAFETMPPGDRSKPVPVGEPASIGDGWTLTVNQVTPDAGDAIAQANRFNDPPKAGHTFVMVNVTATYNGPDESVTSWLDVSVLGPSNVAADEARVVPPDNYDSMADVYQGGSVTGNLVFEMPVGELDQHLVRAEPGFSFGDDVGAFFSLS